MKTIHTPMLGVALACLASLPGAASAQSKVEIFGVVDVGVTHLNGSGPSKTGLSTGGANISRLGFRGTEELGGGLRAGFWLEAGMDVDSGSGKASGGGLSFNRRSTVSLSGDFGEVRLGRDDSATFLSTLIFDPFLTNGVGGTMGFTMLGIPGTGTATGGAPIQISNAVSYFLPQNLGGFYGQVQVAMGEQARSAPNKNQGDYRGLRFGYRQGPFNGALATGKFYGDSDATNLTASNVGLSWDFGVAKPMLLWASEKRGALKGHRPAAGRDRARGHGRVQGLLRPLQHRRQQCRLEQDQRGLRAQPVQAHPGLRHGGLPQEQGRRGQVHRRAGPVGPGHHAGRPLLRLRGGRAPLLLIQPIGR